MGSNYMGAVRIMMNDSHWKICLSPGEQKLQTRLYVQHRGLGEYGVNKVWKRRRVELHLSLAGGLEPNESIRS